MSGSARSGRLRAPSGPHSQGSDVRHGCSPSRSGSPEFFWSAVASTVAGDRALQRGVADIEPIDRAFTVVDVARSVADRQLKSRQLDETIDGAFSSRGFGPVLRTVEYRPLAAGDGRTVRFAGVDDPQTSDTSRRRSVADALRRH